MTPHDLLTSLEILIRDADHADCAALIGRLETMKVLAWNKVMIGPAVHPVPSTEYGHYLTVSEVAERFNVTPKWLYRHKRQIPHSQPSRKVLLFPEQGITKWFARRKGT